MREIVFMWIAAMASFVFGFVAGRRSRRVGPLRESYGMKHQAPGAASEPEETFTDGQGNRYRHVEGLQAGWEATRDDEQRQDRPLARVEHLPNGGGRFTNAAPKPER